MIDMHDTAELVSRALRRAWQLGQTYWQQADSEYQSHWKRADATQGTFNQLVEDTRAAILAANSSAHPAPSFADAYEGAMEEVAIWKKRALEAEDLNRKFFAEINGPTYMGEPAHPKPDCGEAGHDEGRCGNTQCLPGAQPAPSVPDGWKLVPIEPTDEMLRAIRAQRSGARKGRGDRADWKAWLAAAPEATSLASSRSPSVPDGWLRAIDEALVVTHLGVADESYTYEQAREKLTNLIGWHVDVATDPAVNGGWKLVPIEPTTEIRKAMHYAYWQSPQLPYHDGSPELWNAAYAAMLEAAPEIKS